MCESVVIRVPTSGKNIREYRTKTGDWSMDQNEALKTSEEDARAIVRTLRQADRPPAHFEYDENIVAE